MLVFRSGSSSLRWSRNLYTTCGKYNKLNEVKVVITEVAVIVEERW